MKISAPRGTQDALPKDTNNWQYLEKKLREVAFLFGFGEIRFPVFEHTELFLRGIGDTTDVVQKEMYTFNDKKGRSLTLRPEGTASVVRAFVEHGLYAETLPFKCYYIAPNFRYEAPQKGRLRQHHQFGIECFGTSLTASSDVEVIALAATYIEKLGLRDISLKINSIGCKNCRPQYKEKLINYLSKYKENLCPDCKLRLEKNPLRVLDCKNEACKKIAKDAPKNIDNLCGDCKTHMDDVKAELTAMGINYEIDPFIVRGLDYYTKTVFEFTTTSIGAQATICGGGRYDGLVESLDGPAISGVGFGSGLERLLLTMEAQGVLPENKNSPQIYIAPLGSCANIIAGKLCFELHKEGIAAVRDITGRGVRPQMKYADKLGAEFSIVLGDKEIEDNSATLRNMKTGDTFSIKLETQDIKSIIL